MPIPEGNTNYPRRLNFFFLLLEPVIWKDGVHNLLGNSYHTVTAIVGDGGYPIEPTGHICEDNETFS